MLGKDAWKSLWNGLLPCPVHLLKKYGATPFATRPLPLDQHFFGTKHDSRAYSNCPSLSPSGPSGRLVPKWHGFVADKGPLEFAGWMLLSAGPPQNQGIARWCRDRADDAGTCITVSGPAAAEPSYCGMHQWDCRSGRLSLTTSLWIFVCFQRFLYIKTSSHPWISSPPFHFWGTFSCPPWAPTPQRSMASSSI